MTAGAPETPICRAPHPGEMPAVRALLAEQVSDPYVARALELLELAAQGSAEYHAIVVASGDGQRPAGVGIYGLVAGAHAAGVIHSVIARDSAATQVLVEAILRELETMRARFAVAELAEEPMRASLRAVLEERGFREESRVPDLYREGIALAFLRRDLTPRS